MSEMSSQLVKQLDIAHHDIPDRHQYGEALIDPTSLPLVSSGAGAIGTSPAPAHADHVHPAQVIPPPPVYTGPRGIIARRSGTFPSGVNLTTTPTTLESFNANLETGRMYRLAIWYRAAQGRTRLVITVTPAGSTFAVDGYNNAPGDYFGAFSVDNLGWVSATGSYHFVLQGIASPASTLFWDSGANIYIEDIGPFINPS